MDLTQLLIRAFSLDQDLHRLLSLYAIAEAADHAGTEMSEQALRDQLISPGSTNLMDRWVVAAPDDPYTLIGSALVKINHDASLSEANILVHPDWRQRGIGTALLSKVVQWSRQRDATAIQIYASTIHPDAPIFLKKRAFSAQGSYTEQRLTETVRLPPVIWPYGYTMRTYAEIQDYSILTQAMNLCYIPLWGHREVSEEEMASRLPEFNHHGLFLVFSEKGRVIGISRVEPSPARTAKNGLATGYIDAPGVVPQHRRLDLYRALVLTGINWLRNQSQSWVEMESWGDKQEVLKMYRELGFMDIRQLACYQLDLSDGVQADPPVSL